MSPRAVFGLPLYNPGPEVVEAVESLLSQTCRDFALCIVDDSTDDSGASLIAPYLDDPRVSYHRNPKRLGLTRNWKHAFELATELHPDADYFAWASDHDVWHPRWLEALIRRLDRRPDATGAYTDDAVVTEDGTLRRRRPSADAAHARSAAAILWLLSRQMRAGQLVYGLFRVEAVRSAGGFRHVLYPDRLFLAEVGLQGPLLRAPEVLWYKRPTAEFSTERQRRACFPDTVPLHAYLPWWLNHAAAICWFKGVRGTSRPQMGMGEALEAAVLYAIFNGAAVVRGRRRRVLKAYARRRRRRRLTAARG